MRPTPPPDVVEGLGAGLAPEPAVTWQADRLGSDGPFPNGGMWRVHPLGTAGRSTVVKRTGAAHLGGDPVWAGSLDAADPQWWGREAAFYASELAVTGWSGDCRAVRCLAIDDHDDVRDLWLEDIDLPLPETAYDRAVQGLAGWQVHHRGVDRPWLSHGWIAAHVGRRRLDNARTLDDGRWARLFEAGIPSSVRSAVRERVVDPEAVERHLRGLPQLLTHYDFHHLNLGRAGEQIAIIDWATVGPGPVGHDVGVLLVDHGHDLGEALPEAWQHLIATYAQALRDAGLQITTADVERSAAISNVLRHGWVIDHVLGLSDQLSQEVLGSLGPLLVHLAALQHTYLPRAT